MGNPHAGFDEAGGGNGLLGIAPAFDPTCEILGGGSPGRLDQKFQPDISPLRFEKRRLNRQTKVNIKE